MRKHHFNIAATEMGLIRICFSYFGDKHLKKRTQMDEVMLGHCGDYFQNLSPASAASVLFNWSLNPLIFLL